MALYPLDLYRRAEAKCMRERLGKFALTVHPEKTPSPRAPARLTSELLRNVSWRS